MTIALVSLSDTFQIQMNKINQGSQALNGLSDGTGSTQISNNAIAGVLVNVFSNTPFLLIDNSHLQSGNSVNVSLGPLSIRANDTSQVNIASAFIVNTAYSAAKTASDRANTASDNANGSIATAYAQANIAYNQANNAYVYANTLPAQIGSAFAQANIAVAAAATAYGAANNSSNVVLTQANVAYTQANLAFNQANSAYVQANTALTTGQSAYAQANTSAQRTFKIINANGSVITASSNSDTVTLIAGPGIIITANTANNGIILSSSASGVLKSVHRQIFTANGTYTPSSGMVSAFIRVQATGGGGGGASSTGVDTSAGNGGAGGYSEKLVTAADIGASKPVTIGSVGSGGSSGNHDGSAGTDSSVGVLCVAHAGHGGSGRGSNSTPGSPGSGGAQGVGDLTILGENATQDYAGNSFLSKQAPPLADSNGNGTSAVEYGAGGSGARSVGSNRSGGDGGPSIIIIDEYCSV